MEGILLYMKVRKIVKAFLILAGVGILSATGIAAYLFNKPHRDVQSSSVDFDLTSTVLVRQYLTNPEEANNKYLDDSGNSRILSVKGKVKSISRDMNNQLVLLLKDEGEKAGVSCTFTSATNDQAAKILVGQSVTVKGVIRSGAGYDEDLDLYEDVILEKCSILDN